MHHCHGHHPISMPCADISESTSDGSTKPQLSLHIAYVGDKMTKQNQRSNQSSGYRARRADPGKLRERRRLRTRHKRYKLCSQFCPKPSVKSLSVFMPPNTFGKQYGGLIRGGTQGQVNQKSVSK